MDSSPTSSLRFVLSTYDNENPNFDELGIFDSRLAPVESDFDLQDANPYLYCVVPDTEDEGDDTESHRCISRLRGRKRRCRRPPALPLVQPDMFPDIAKSQFAPDPWLIAAEERWAKAEEVRMAQVKFERPLKIEEDEVLLGFLKIQFPGYYK